MRVLIATDAFAPQVNGVVRSLEKLRELGPRHGLDVAFLAPRDFRSWPMPGYPEIRLSLAGRRHALAALDRERPDAVHIATEGPIGWAMRAAFPSPRAITRASPNICARGCRCRRHSAMAGCDGSTTQEAAS